MLKYAIDFHGPIALRYPRGEAYDGLQEFRSPIALGKSEILYEEADIALLAVGSMVKAGEEVRSILKDAGYNCTLVNGRFVKPLDEESLETLSRTHRLFVTLEENVRSGGYGEKVLDYVADRGLSVKVLNVSIPDEYVEHGNVAMLFKEVGLDAQTIAKQVITAYVGQM